MPLRLTFQAIRNEAHRFAIFYYRYLHAKQFRRTPKKIRKKD
jgi:excinuclease UvrABC nuclease subunit